MQKGIFSFIFKFKNIRKIKYQYLRQMEQSESKCGKLSWIFRRNKGSTDTLVPWYLFSMIYVYQILDHVYILCALAYLSTGNYTRSIPDIIILYTIILHGDFIYSEYQQLFWTYQQITFHTFMRKLRVSGSIVILLTQQ